MYNSLYWRLCKWGLISFGWFLHSPLVYLFFAPSLIYHLFLCLGKMWLFIYLFSTIRPFTVKTVSLMVWDNHSVSIDCNLASFSLIAFLVDGIPGLSTYLFWPCDTISCGRYSTVQTHYTIFLLYTWGGLGNIWNMSRLIGPSLLAKSSQPVLAFKQEYFTSGYLCKIRRERLHSFEFQVDVYRAWGQYVLLPVIMDLHRWAVSSESQTSTLTVVKLQIWHLALALIVNLTVLACTVSRSTPQIDPLGHYTTNTPIQTSRLAYDLKRSVLVAFYQSASEEYTWKWYRCSL